MINKYTNKQRGLLAVIMAMVMVFAGAAFVAAEVDAESTALPSAEDGVITLTENVNITVSDSVGFTIAEGQTVKIDLKGYTITGIYNGDDDDTTNKALIVNNGTLTIIDSSAGGKITSNNNMDLIVNNGVLAINGGILDVNCENDNDNTSYPGASALVNNVGGTTTITSVDIDSESIRSYAVINKGTMSISPAQGSTVTVDAAKGAVASDAGTLTVDGGEYVAGTWHALYVSDDASSTDADTVVTVNGGSFTGGNWGHAVADYSDINDEVNSDVKLIGGTFNGSIYVYDKAAQSPGVQVIGGIYSTDVTEYAVDGAKYIVDETMYFKNCVVGESIEIEDVTSIEGTAFMNAGGSFTIPTGITLNELVITAADGSKVEFNGIITSGEISISNGSVVIGGDIETIGGTIVVKSGTAKVTGSIDVSITVESGATLVVPKDVEVSGKVTNSGTIDLSGQLTNNGTDDNANSNSGTIEVNDVSAVVNATNTGTIILNKQIEDNTSNVSGGTIALANGITVPEGVSGTNFVSAESVGDSFGMSKDLESDYTVKTSAFLANDLTIPEGVTLTIDGTLSLNGKKLFVEGTLAVGKKGVITDISGSTGAIILSKTGAIVNEGIIGKDSTVKVTDENATPKTVSMKNVIGLSFGLTKEIGATGPTYTLTVSGEAAKKGDAPTLTIDGAYLSDLVVKDLESEVIITGNVLKDGSLNIGSKATVASSNVILQNGATLMIDGKITNGTITIWNGSSATINGDASGITFTAETGEYPTYNGSQKNDLDKDVELTVASSSIKTDLKGITIDITSKVYSKKNSGVTTSYTMQMMEIYGTPSFKDKDTDDGEIDIDGKVYIPAGQELVLVVGMELDTETDDGTGDETEGTVITEGTLKISASKVKNYKGAAYSVEVTPETGSKYTDYIYTTFDDAYAVIESADDMEIVIKGGYTFTKEYTVGADQTVEFSDGEYKISKDGKITVMEDGTLSEGFVVATTEPVKAAGIQGILVVMDGGDCTPADKSYEVSSRDADGNMIYTSAQNAIANAQPGETIYITNPVTFTEDATIPEGVTVDVASGAIITAEKELDIAGKLINNGTVTVTGGDLTVTGEVDNNGTFSITSAGEGATDKNEATITGEFVGALTATDGINAAQFTNDDGENTYTNVADAMAAIAEMDVPTGLTIYGKVTEASEITLVEGMTLTVNGELVIDSIKLVFGSNLTVGDKGALTTDVIAAVGTPETTGALTDATVAVNKVSGVTNWTVSYNASKDEYSMEMPAYTSGDVVIEAGSVNYNDANASFGAVTGSTPVVYKTMKVVSGATLVVTGNVTDDASKKYFVNEGTIVVSDSKNFTNVLLGGTVNVDLGKTLTLTASQIVGEVVLATEEGKTPASVAISGQVLIGSTPETLGAAGSIVGKVTFKTAGDYVVVFDGSTFNNTDDSTKTLSTQYIINGIEFATVYSTKNVAINVIDGFVVDLNDLKVTAPVGWYIDDPKDVATGTIGNENAILNADINYESVSFIVAVGPGLQVYIDDVEYSTMIKDGKVTETIGTHTITVYIEKGYEGTPAITFNGQTITDGKLVLTSDMLGKENKLVVTGATVMQDQPVVIQPSDSEKDGMELTDILLIVLVVLIVIMAIIVALRMMRS